jgi:hypothetical protein
VAANVTVGDIGAGVIEAAKQIAPEIKFQVGDAEGEAQLESWLLPVLDHLFAAPHNQKAKKGT